MEQIALKAQLRDNSGNGSRGSKHLRDKGMIPAVVYHRGEGTVNIIVPDKEITRIIHAAGGENILINLTIEKDKKTKPRPVIIKEIQHHPVKRNILHVDFNEISMNEKIVVDVEIVALGEPVGVKQEGGVLDHPLRVLKIQCLPTDIPKHIDVDVSGLKLNQSVHVRDLKLSEKLKVLTEGEHEYDFVFIDTPPSLGLLTVNTLTAANLVVIPVQTHYFAMEGVVQLQETIRQVREDINPGLEILGVVLTMYDRRTLISKEVEAKVRNEFSGRVFSTVIPVNVRLAEAPSYHKSIFEYDSGCNGARAYGALAREILNCPEV